MRSLRPLGAVAIVVAAFSGLGAAAREYTDLFVTPRMNSMGRAVTATVDDYSSLYSNPAGLAQLEVSELRFPDLLAAQISPAINDIYTSIKGVKSSQGAAAISSALSDFDGKGACFGADVLGLGYYSNKIAIGINPLSLNGCVRVRTPTILFAKLQARVTADSGVSLGYGRAFADNHWRAGIALRPFLLRGGLVPDAGSHERTFENTDILSLAQDPSSLMGLGWGFDLDLGVQAEADPQAAGPLKIKPLVGVALQNALATKFSNHIKSEIVGALPPLERKLNIGVAAQVSNLGAFRPTLSFELRDLLIRTDSFLEHVSAALELALKPRRWFQSSLRGHFYKGNVGGGLGLRLSAFELEFGTYAVNLGRGPGIGVDRRLYAQAALVW